MNHSTILMMTCIIMNSKKEKKSISGIILILQFISDLNDNWYTGFVEISLDEMIKCVSELQPNQKP